VGSGTDADNGVVSRLDNYRPGNALLPRFVKQAFNEGYHIAHKGLLCWTPLPTAGLVPRCRARFLVLECLFTVVFHASYAATTDIYIDEFCLWPRDEVEWDPACSHLPLTEAIRGNLLVSPEELEFVAALRTERLAKMGNLRSQKHRARKREEDLEAYQERVRVEKNAWAEKNRSKVNRTASEVKAKAIEAKRFYCDDCELALQSDAALTAHQLTQTHLDTVAGIKKSEITKSAIAVKAVRATAKAKNTHYCPVCKKAFENDWSLTRHKEGVRHLNKVAKAGAVQ
jgi:hypothetical protein